LGELVDEGGDEGSEEEQRGRLGRQTHDAQHPQRLGLQTLALEVQLVGQHDGHGQPNGQHEQAAPAHEVAQPTHAVARHLRQPIRQSNLSVRQELCYFFYLKINHMVDGICNKGRNLMLLFYRTRS